ncbi:MAG: porin family protein [Mangrovibacterium sp.]
MIKNIISMLTMILFVGTTTIFAQTKEDNKENKHEVFISGGGGLSTLSYDTPIGDSESACGFLFGVGYAYKFNKTWSINTGLEITSYNSSMKGSNFSDSYSANDGEYDFVFTTNVAGYTESQQALYLNIPIMAQYELVIGNKTGFYVSGGMKIGIPLVSKYTVDKPTVFNTGYYPDLDVTYDYLNYKGFGTFYPLNEEYDLDLRLSAMLSLETGVKWRISEKFNLYTGLYFDYGLTNSQPNISGHFVNYDVAEENCFVMNGVLGSEYTDTSTKPLVDKVRPIAFGIKIKMALPF